MQEIKFIKTNLIECNVDDIVKDLKELKEKSKWLDSCIYQNNMLIYVEDKKAIYKVKVVL